MIIQIATQRRNCMDKPRKIPKLTAQIRRKSAKIRRLDMSMRVLKALHSAGAPEELSPALLEKQRKHQEILGNLTADMTDMSWQPFPLDSMSAAWMRLSRPHRPRRAILYCHGGGYTSGNLGYSKVLSSKLTKATGLDTLTFEYRLAPEHPYPAAIDDGLRAWNYLMHLGYGARDVVVAGDSAGGNLALVLCHRLKAAGRMLPAALLLMSPWTDMTASGSSMEERRDIDPMLTPEYIRAVRDVYAGDRDWKTPSFSPLFGDFTGFPPALIQVGDHEILYSDSERLHEAMLQAGADCRFEVWDDMWHVFQMFPVKKAAAAMEQTARFLLEIL
jgi:acetyl esterase/lipase